MQEEEWGTRRQGGRPMEEGGRGGCDGCGGHDGQTEGGRSEDPTSCRSGPTTPHCYSSRPLLLSNAFDGNGGGGGRWRRKERKSAAAIQLIMQELLSPVIISAAAVILLLPSLASSAALEEELAVPFEARPRQQDPPSRLSSSSSPFTNCFSLAAPTTWPLMLKHNASVATLTLDLLAAGPDVLGCLSEQRQVEEHERKGLPMLTYKLDLLNDGEPMSSLQASLPRLLDTTSDSSSPVQFRYVLFPGSYSVRFRLCEVEDMSGAGLSIMCKEEDGEGDGGKDAFTSASVATVSDELVDRQCVADAAEDAGEPTFTFSFDLSPSGLGHSLDYSAFFPTCLRRGSAAVLAYPVLPYQMARVELLSSRDESAPCRQNATSDVRQVRSSKVRVSANAAGNMVKLEGQIPDLPEENGVQFYCLHVKQDESLRCVEDEPAANGTSDSACTVSSGWVRGPRAPFLARYLPFCGTHFACGWLYLSALCAAVLTLACLLALCCVHCSKRCCRCCCCCCRRDGRKVSLRAEEGIPFEGLCLNPGDGGSAANTLTPRKTWVELHQEWDVDPPKNPGKILLLYSPDSPTFKELQSSLKSFLELACHCVVLDLFDEELFQSIAFDPEMWLTNLLKDPDFKIIVICSQGAYKRQQAILSKEVLNIPDNSTMDGLFSAGLRFIQAQHAYDYSRLALARYEMLHTTSAEFRLQEMVPNREFLVPTQLHELFCWIHGYDPLDLLGKPWDRYHLELQLLTDALRQARMEKRKQQQQTTSATRP